MEKLQGPILHPSVSLFEEQIGEESDIMMGINNYGQFINNRSFQDPHCCTTTLPSLEDKMPFLQMLQGVVQYSLPPPPPVAETAMYPLMQEPNFQLLLRLQQEKLINMRSCFGGELTNNINIVTTIDNTNNNSHELHSPVKSELNHERKKGVRSAKKTTVHLSKSDANLRESATGAGAGARRKRKRAARPSKNKEQVETQRMTHIAVERNRRRQMNEHLNALRSLMPPSYIQRGDQASIIGGAIDFVKELEQLLQSLQAQKRMSLTEERHQNGPGDVSATSTSTSSSSNLLGNMFIASSSSSPSSSTLQFRNPHEDGTGNGTRNGNGNGDGNGNQEGQLLFAENRSSIGDIEVVVIQNHVNLKIQCQRRPGQLLKAIVALEDLRLSVLHLNITSFHALVLYSFNLKIEDDCKLGSADEVASAVHHIFSFINIT